MFERFRIKAALRAQVIGLRAGGDVDALSRAELIFFEPAFTVTPLMKQRGWTPDQAMVFMVTDVVVVAGENGDLAALADSDPAVFAALRRIYRHVVALAAADPALAAVVSRAADRPEPFADDAV